MALNIDDDWMIFDNLQTITFYSKISDGTFAAGIGGQALKREDHKVYKEAESQFELNKHYVIWEIWKTSMNSPVVPKRGDKLTALTISGLQTFIVTRLDYCDFTSRYRTFTYQSNEGS